MKCQFFCWAIALALITQVQAQHQLGFHLDNYAGINSVYLNPSSSITTPFNWDANLIAGNFFFDNNYFFYRQTKVLDILNHANGGRFGFGPRISSDVQIPDDVFIIDFFDDDADRFAHLNVRVMGPSFYIRINENNQIGLFSSFRLLGNGTGISNNLSYYRYNFRPFFETFPVGAAHLSATAWSEIGLNYIRKLSLNNGDLAIGISVKYLQGYEAAFLQSAGDFNLTKQPDEFLQGSPIQFDFGLTTSNLKDDNYGLERNGSGFGLDIGATFIIPDYEDNYKWKFGVSIMDIGRINFNKSSQLHRVLTDGDRIIDGNAYSDFDAASEVIPKIQLFSEQTLGDPNASLVADNFTVWLPAAFSLQADYAFTPNIYFNFTTINAIPISNTTGNRASLTAISARFEKRWYGATVPISLLNWKDLRMGLGIRLGFISFGTDNLGSFFTDGDFSGGSFYFALKVNPFSLGGGKNKGHKFRSGKRRGKNVQCYQF